VAKKKQRKAHPATREWIYEVAGPREAAGAIGVLDRLPLDKLVGLGIFAKGFEGDPERFYVYANVADATPEDERKVTLPMAEFGKRTTLTFNNLFYDDPRPHFTATGPGVTILIGLKAAYPTAFDPQG
jgi:hypothetical protein